MTLRRSASSASGCARERAVVVRVQKVRVAPAACAVLQAAKELKVVSAVRQVAKELPLKAALLKADLPVLQAVPVGSVHKAALRELRAAPAAGVVRVEWSWA